MSRCFCWRRAVPFHRVYVTMDKIRVVPGRTHLLGKSDPVGSSATVWRHLVSVVLLGVLAQMAVAVSWSHAQGESVLASLIDAVPAVGGWVFGMVPIATGVSVAFVCRIGRGHLLRLALVGTIAMVLIDAVAPTHQLEVGQRVAVQGNATFADPNLQIEGRVSVTRTALAFIGGGGDGVSERLTRYPPGHPRVRASHALLKGSFLALPLVLASLLGATMLWMDQQVIFRRAAARRIGRLWVAWLATLVVHGFWSGLATRGRAGAMFGGAALPVILLPAFVFGALAIVAWRSVPSDRAIQRVGD